MAACARSSLVKSRPRTRACGGQSPTRWPRNNSRAPFLSVFNPAISESSTVCLHPVDAVRRDIVKRPTVNQILIVDDSPTIRRMVKASLAALSGPCEFVEASSGLEAIERLALGPVELMVLDLNMPDMHGLEVLGFVR